MNIAHILLVDLEAGTGLVLVGELHRDTAPCCARLVGDVSPTGRGDIEIDVRALTFCDVSGLNPLLAARTSGRYQGRFCASARCVARPRPVLGRDRYPLPHRWPVTASVLSLFPASAS
ncbi:STAS domain-containing protein [Streptomyces sp. NBC_01602]|uniref:STAS domain-containing protein n=1 Tax=Streptomyces sp. NBC_01602 TaxID=2975893 RepID=UPI00386E097B